jgi:hypothetical protein
MEGSSSKAYGVGVAARPKAKKSTLELAQSSCNQWLTFLKTDFVSCSRIRPISQLLKDKAKKGKKLHN